MKFRNLLLAFAYLHLTSLGLAQVVSIEAKTVDKLSPSLVFELKTKTGGLDILVLLDAGYSLPEKYIAHRKGLPRKTVLGFVQYLQAVQPNKVGELAAIDGVKYLELVRRPATEAIATKADLSTNQINLMQYRWPLANGSGFTLSIKEERFDTSDIDLRGRGLFSSYSSPEKDLHANFMATLAGGGGNSGEGSTGVVPAVLLSSDSYENLFPTADDYFASQNVTVQNHSYGTAIDNYYGLEAAAYDAHCQAHPEIVHVFSAGNSGQEAANIGVYANLTGFANLTGRFKQSKNSISVGCTDSLGIPLAISSHGPAHDGRLKPELMAFGTGGTSEAAALASGTAIAMQQAFSQSHNGQLPPSSLIRAVMANTAKDSGRPNPDYETGFGNLNAERCLATLMEGRFSIDSISANEVKTYALEAPNNASSIKITLAWNDPAASIHAERALVNDIDLGLSHPPTSSLWLPWTLNAFPHTDSLSMPAHRGRDSLNNIEQVSLEMPLSGTYQILVTAPQNLQGRQVFSLTWQVDTLGGFDWTAPIENGIFPPKTGVILRWASSLPTNSGSLSFRYLNENWQPISTNTALAEGYFKPWITPEKTGLAQLKMETLAGDFLSDSFLIAPQLRPKVGFDCQDSLLLFWDTEPSAGTYQLFSLGEKYLELVDEVADTFYIEDEIGKSKSFYYAVAPVIAGVLGPKSQSFDYTKQGVDCYLGSFYFTGKTEDKASFAASVGSLYGLESAELERLTASGFIASSTVSNLNNTNFYFTDIPVLEGVNRFRLKLVLENGGEVFSDTVPVYHLESDAYLLYPNPIAEGNQAQLLSRNDLIAAYEIFNAQGQFIRKGELDSQPTLVGTKDLAAGCYLIRVQDEKGGKWIGKLMIW
ncbi:MAG: S8 family peptidase [Saprospiraceae bacterium]|nr:S8 family peptidase [Saprospiraceae bacterium]